MVHAGAVGGRDELSIESHRRHPPLDRLMANVVELDGVLRINHDGVVGPDSVRHVGIGEPHLVE